MQPNDEAASATTPSIKASTTTARRPDAAADSTGGKLADAVSATAAPPAAPGEWPLSAGATNEARPNDSPALARLIAEGRRPRSRRFAELEPYRDVLLAERRAGASIRLMARSLAQVGVTISQETLRVWLLRHKMPKRRRSRKKATVAKPVPVAPAAVAMAPFVPAWQRKGPCIARDDL